MSTNDFPPTFVVNPRISDLQLRRIEKMFPDGAEIKYTTDPKRCVMFNTVPRVIENIDLVGRDLLVIVVKWAPSSPKVERSYLHPDLGRVYPVALCRDVDTKAEFSFSTGSIGVAQQLYEHGILNHLPLECALEIVNNGDYESYALVE